MTDAAQHGIHVLFSVYGTPTWANGGQAMNVAPAQPDRPAQLRLRRGSALQRLLRRPRRDSSCRRSANGWPGTSRTTRSSSCRSTRADGTGWTIASAAAYAKICNAVYHGVHGTLLASERVACGGTAPRGNNNPTSSRPSVSPLAFLRAVKNAGLKTFDAWAHHPYYSCADATRRLEAGDDERRAGHRGDARQSLDLITLVTQLYGNKRIWITEYGYQTNPPDTIVGVSWAKQALYLKQAFAIARANPRIDLMLWFLLVDDPNPDGWQSGLITTSGKHKPSFAAFESLTQ